MYAAVRQARARMVQVAFLWAFVTNGPASSVLNKHSQAHEVKNLFVADAGPFVTNAHKNATWTILALAWRTAAYIAEDSRKGDL